VGLGAVGVIPSGQTNIGDLVESRRPRLTRFPLNRIEQVFLVMEHSIVETHHDGAAVRQGCLRPKHSSGTRRLEGALHIGGRRLRESRNQGPIGGAEVFVVAIGAWEN
jgi:hypothetical protein